MVLGVSVCVRLAVAVKLKDRVPVAVAVDVPDVVCVRVCDEL